MLEYLGIDDSFIAGSICTACVICYVLLGWALVITIKLRSRYERRHAPTGAPNTSAPHGAGER